jgi:hypothetical protein
MIYQIPSGFNFIVIELLFIKIDTEQYTPLCLCDVSLMSVKCTSGNVLTLQQGTGILLSLRHEADVDENSHKFVAGYISMFENNEAIDDN